ncbi:MAG TPA: type IV pili twitching motility protein PilT [Actinobacteria bacterium]|nr:type IV pili twitching motility protein PilT [Actinomycetota bacterium]
MTLKGWRYLHPFLYYRAAAGKVLSARSEISYMEDFSLLRFLVDVRGSDLHIKAGSKPCLRVDGVLRSADLPVFDMDEVEQFALTMMNDRQKNLFADKNEIDFALTLPGIGRFRTNIFKQRGSIGLAIRRVMSEQLSIAELDLPPIVEELVQEPRGLILVTGVAGSGKTTTLNTMIDHINRTQQRHIITIEDPIEVLHKDINSFVNQREIGVDTDSYADALKHVVRQDPDVIMIGEMRDMETAQASLTAAEIGNLVLSSLHTVDTAETINRIIDLFPPYQQKQVRIMLAATLKGIISLRLLPRVGGGRIPAVEVMVSTATIKEYIINEDETSKINEAIEQGGYYGMQSFDQALLSLIEADKIRSEDALAMSSHAHDFKLKAKQAGFFVA